jgi:hypothetical protein
VRRVLPAIGLFLLAPLVGEFLLGDLPITAFTGLVILAPMYGGGTLLIREVCRRAGWGWPSMLALALAYGVLEEGITTQTLFNPGWTGHHLHAYGNIPALGMGGPWTVFVLSLHMLWSTTIPIMFVELLTPGRRRTPWLGRIGLAATSVIFVAGAVVLTVGGYSQSDFRASVAQYAGCVVAMAVLILLAVFLGRSRGPATRREGRVPSAWLLGAAAFAVSSVELGIWYLGKDVVPAWLYVALVVLTYATVLPLARYWTRFRAWNARHELALASGALLTYVWLAFAAPHMLLPASPAVALTSHVVFGLGAVALIAVTAARLDRAAKAERAGAAPEVSPVR